MTLVFVRDRKMIYYALGFHSFLLIFFMVLSSFCMSHTNGEKKMKKKREIHLNYHNFVFIRIDKHFFPHFIFLGKFMAKGSVYISLICYGYRRFIYFFLLCKGMHLKHKG